MTSEQRSAEERLRAPREQLIKCLVSECDGRFPEADDRSYEQREAVETLHLAIEDHIEAAEARGRAQGQREGREAERADVVAWHQSQADKAETDYRTAPRGDMFASSLLSQVAVHSAAKIAIEHGEHVGAAERGEEA